MRRRLIVMIRVVLFSARLGSKAGHVIGRALDVMFGALTWAEPVRGAALVWSQPSRAARHVPNKPSTITLVRLTQPNRSATHVTSVRLKTGTSFRPRTREKPSPALGRVHERILEKRTYNTTFRSGHVLQTGTQYRPVSHCRPVLLNVRRS